MLPSARHDSDKLHDQLQQEEKADNSPQAEGQFFSQVHPWSGGQDHAGA